MASYVGKCHCGRVSWTAVVPEAKHILCHCGACKAISGSEYTLNQVIPKDNFAITKGTVNKYVYRGDSGQDVDCFFCPSCSAHPYHFQHSTPDTVIVRTILLQGSDQWGKPGEEVYGKDKLDWQPQTGDKVFEMEPLR